MCSSINVITDEKVTMKHESIHTEKSLIKNEVEIYRVFAEDIEISSIQ